MGGGGGSVHNGRTWHGSGVNISKRLRRGLGIHFGPIGARPVPPTSLARQMATKGGRETRVASAPVTEVLPGADARLSAPALCSSASASESPGTRHVANPALAAAEPALAQRVDQTRGKTRRQR